MGAGLTILGGGGGGSGVMEYKGTWNATTNTPALVDGAGSPGDVYKTTVAGTHNFGSGAIAFEVGEYVVYNGSTWEKDDTIDQVFSVFGRTGAVTPQNDDYSIGQIAEADAALAEKADLTALEDETNTRTIEAGFLNERLDENSEAISSEETRAKDAEAALKAEIEASELGLSVKQSVALATATALPANVYANGASGAGATLTGVGFGALEIDGTKPLVGQRVLVNKEVAESHNGIYTVTKAGAVAELYVLTRSTDLNTAAQFDGAFTLVEGGATESAKGWTIASTGVVTVGTTAITWTEFGTPAFEGGKLKESYLPASVASISTGEGAPAKGLPLNRLYIQVEGSKHIALWRGKGAGEEPEQVADLSGIPADGSVTGEKVNAALVDPAIATPGLRSGAFLASLAGVWRSRHSTAGQLSGAAVAATKYFLLPAQANPAELGGSSTQLSYPWRIGWVAADEAVSGFKTKCKIKAEATIGTTAAKVTVKFALFKVTKGEKFVLGEEVSGSGFEVALGETVKDGVSGESAEFEMPADGDYALGVIVSGTPNATFDLQSRLLVHAV